MKNRLAAYQAEQAGIVSKMDALLEQASGQEHGALTAEQFAIYDGLEAERQTVAASIAREEKLREAQRTAPADAIPAARGVHNREEDKPWANLGEFLIGVRNAARSVVDPRLMAAATGMGEALGPDGGYAVPTEFSTAIEKTMWETGQILSRVSARPVGGNSMTYLVNNETSRATGSRRGGVQGYWIDEGGAPTASKPTLAKVELKLRKAGCLGYMSSELISDAPALQAELESGFAEELQFMAEDAIVNGTGVAQPQGFLAAPCLVTVTVETGQTIASGSVVVENLSKMWSRMPARSKANAVWLINTELGPVLDKLSIAVGTAALEPRFVTYGPDGLLRIKGRPVVEVEYAAAEGTTGDISLCDFSQYRVITKGGVEQASSIHVRFANDESTFRALYRIDGQPLPRAAVSPYKGSASLSPFVALGTRS